MIVTKSNLIELGRVLRDLAVSSFDPGTVAQVTGQEGNIMTVDIDTEDVSPLIMAFAHRKTPKGFHIDVEYQAGVAIQLPNADLLSNGRCAVVFGSKKNVPYRWLRDPQPWKMSELPAGIFVGKTGLSKGLYTVEYEELRQGVSVGDFWVSVVEPFREGTFDDPAYRSHDRALRLQANPKMRRIKRVEWEASAAHGYHA